MDSKDRVPVMMVGGKIIDFNSMSVEELKQMEEELEKKQEEIRKKIYDFLNK